MCKMMALSFSFFTVTTGTIVLVVMRSAIFELTLCILAGRASQSLFRVKLKESEGEEQPHQLCQYQYAQSTKNVQYPNSQRLGNLILCFYSSSTNATVSPNSHRCGNLTYLPVTRVLVYFFQFTVQKHGSFFKFQVFMRKKEKNTKAESIGPRIKRFLAACRLLYRRGLHRRRIIYHRCQLVILRDSANVIFRETQSNR